MVNSNIYVKQKLEKILRTFILTNFTSLEVDVSISAFYISEWIILDCPVNIIILSSTDFPHNYNTFLSLFRFYYIIYLNCFADPGHKQNIPRWNLSEIQKHMG